MGPSSSHLRKNNWFSTDSVPNYGKLTHHKIKLLEINMNLVMQIFDISVNFMKR